MSSPILKSFTFVPQPKPSSDPLIIKRERMIARLEDQKKLLADPNFVRTVKLRIPTKSPGYNGMMSPGIPE